MKTTDKGDMRQSMLNSQQDRGAREHLHTFGQPTGSTGSFHGQTETGLVAPGQEPAYVEGISATTSPDNANSGSSAYLIAVITIIAVSLLIGAFIGVEQAAIAEAEKNFSSQQMQEQLFPDTNEDLESSFESSALQS
jgi:hypothetical protein